jgi:hypothetical protein
MISIKIVDFLKRGVLVSDAFVQISDTLSANLHELQTPQIANRSGDGTCEL